MAEKVLVVGGGGREHALAWKLAQSPQVQQVLVAPGNAGTANCGKICNSEVSVSNHAILAQFCKDHHVGLVVVGPEVPLAAGMVDDLTAAGVPCFGPSAKAAQLEASKSFSKAFMERHGIPTARYGSFTAAEEACSYIRTADFPALVVKASGLAAGKGVIVAGDREEACRAVMDIMKDRAFGSAGETVVVEELLEGEEVSCLCFSDGSCVSAMPPAQDHKRLQDGDLGPNTGGMGAYCPTPQVSPELLQEIRDTVLQKTVDGMRKEGTPYVGVLYAGLMLTKQGLKVLEFNCRFGDPECQVLLPLLKSDLYEVILNTMSGKLLSSVPAWHRDSSAVTVVMASAGYPGSYKKGVEITGLSQVEDSGVQVFHAGTALKEGGVVSSGGRVLTVTAVKPSLESALQAANQGVAAVGFPGAVYRRDIGHRAIAHLKRDRRGLTYKDCGVDIDAGNKLVEMIKPLAKKTSRPGCNAELGGFAGLFDLKQAGFADPILVSGTDGVGTKLRIAQACGRHGGLGQDLVAMCVNDVLAQGAEPLFFLDYFSCGRLDVDVAAAVVGGVAAACKLAGCALLGGETAEMPGVYAEGEYDLAGFCVGAVERGALLPRLEDIREGDLLVGVASSGVHSNGFSLVSKVLQRANLEYSSPALFADSGQTVGDVLLTPTKIYSHLLQPILRSGAVKAFAHITGGGLLENIPRVLPQELAVDLDASRWSIPPVFSWLHEEGGLSEEEMARTFNCGLGAVLVVAPVDAQRVLCELQAHEEAWIVGSLAHKRQGAKQVVVHNLKRSLQAAGAALNKEPAVDQKMPCKRIRIADCVDGSVLSQVQDSGLQVVDAKLNCDRRGLTYKDCGVDIDAGNKLVEMIKPLAKKTSRPGCNAELGGFAGLFDLKQAGFADPILVSGTDGVGTKLRIAQACGRHGGLGQDLVAMCVNDVLAQGAEPLFFLDYFSCGRLDVDVAAAVVGGVAAACKLAGCALLGGETAEMPGVYAEGEYDLAGFCVGAVERGALLPRLKDIREGDLLVGVASSGVHSNGFSLVSKVLQRANLEYGSPALFADSGRTVGDVLLTPTKIYSHLLQPILRSGAVKAFAHITGGGLLENIPRVLPQELAVDLDASRWSIPPVFSWLHEEGGLSEEEMARTFNCGLGAVLVVAPVDAQRVLCELQAHEEAWIVGSLAHKRQGAKQVVVHNLKRCLNKEPAVEQNVGFHSNGEMPRKRTRVAVLISGTGTNLQALIEQAKRPSSSAEIVVVISNRPRVQGLMKASKAGIQTRVVDHKLFGSRAEFDGTIDRVLEEFGVELVCLAGFMRILTGTFVKKWNGKLLNIHPSLLPSFKGVNAQKQALQAGVRVTGCTVHFVAEEVDAGAIIVQEAVSVRAGDTEESLSDRIREAEHRAFPAALELVASGAVRLREDGRIVWEPSSSS
ncbi:trifunctional purine biosynthetic protein adenosine-3 [Pungitius pungitius]|uniref:trifunctional purine biosynthetic protein adenosine-3 n=1 Tax=Pungitius pungitius TaxID=134920 RepID=UPI002E0E558B